MNGIGNIVDVNFALAFISGILAFFSPCTYPLLPSFIAMISNSSFENIHQNNKIELKKNINLKILFSNLILPIISFGIGFTLIFTLLGASSTIIGKILIKYKKIYSIITSIIIIILGLFLSGIIKIKQLNFEKRIYIKKESRGLFFPFIFGVTFAFGWSPCIGPILASILIIASSLNSLTKGVLLLLTFSFSFLLMFLIAGIIFYFSINSIKKLNKFIPAIKIISSIIIIIYGILFFIKNF
ncbi:MAG: cytochrome c biogenesis protein CcdA [Spirochaetes bacterium]|nr:cytochrome c biogenesis protein CcdA [Spirochaetota bacterium]